MYFFLMFVTVRLYVCVLDSDIVSFRLGLAECTCALTVSQALKGSADKNGSTF